MSSHASSSGSNGSSRWKNRDQLQSTKKAISKLGRGSSTSTNSNETKRRDRGGGGGGGGEAESGKQKKEREAKCVTVWSQVQLIRYVACAEIAVAVIIVLAQVRQSK